MTEAVPLRTLATICARGGSRGLKDKNILSLNGKPLIAYTIDAVKSWGGANRIIVSTDSRVIASIANKYGAETPFLRPPELATDTAAKLPVIQHAVRFCEEESGLRYDVVIDLQPTSPLRSVDDIQGAFDLFMETRPDVLYTVKESKDNPYFTMVELDESGFARLSKKTESEVFRRQDVPKVYTINGSLYIFDRDFLMNTSSLHNGNARVYIMDELSSVDIDTELDFRFIEFLLRDKTYSP